MKEAPRRVRKEAVSRPRGRFLPPVPLCAALCPRATPRQGWPLCDAGRGERVTWTRRGLRSTT